MTLVNQENVHVLILPLAPWRLVLSSPEACATLAMLCEEEALVLQLQPLFALHAPGLYSVLRHVWLRPDFWRLTLVDQLYAAADQQWAAAGEGVTHESEPLLGYDPGAQELHQDLDGQGDLRVAGA